MNTLDAALARGGAVDGRLVGPRLAEAIRACPPEELGRVIGCARLRTRWIVGWDRTELAWWRALDEALSPVGGWARVMLPAFDRRLEGERERDPLEVLADEIASVLDGAPESEPVRPVLGDLTGDASGCDPSRVEIVACADRLAQAEAAARIVAETLAAGTALDRVAVAVAATDAAALAPLRQALADAGVVAFDARAEDAGDSALVDVAFEALEAAETLDRRVVARLLASGYVEPTKLVPGSPREAQRALAAFARALERAFTAAGEDASSRFVRTAAAAGADAALAERVAAVLGEAGRAHTRRQRVGAARALWDALGLGSRAGRGGLRAFGSDDPPSGIADAERRSVARDARAWDTLLAALARDEAWSRGVGMIDEPVDGALFGAELRELVERTATAPPGARLGAIRVGRLRDLAGERLDRLVVLDANAGIFPPEPRPDALVSEALRRALLPGPPPPRARADMGALAAIALAADGAAQVTLAWVQEDEPGAAAAPSPIVECLLRAGVRARAFAVSAAPGSSEDALRRARREAAREAFFLDPRRPRSDVVGCLAPRAEVRALLVEATGGGRRSLSVTALERFARCAFMGYAYVVLAAREVEEADELPDAREEGIVLHDALRAAFVANASSWPRRPRDRDALVARGLDAAERVLAAWEGHLPLRRIVRRRVQGAVARLLAAAAEDDAWDFTLGEQRVGGRGDRDEEWPALDLGADGHVLALGGMLDRLDRAHDGSMVRVIDYKRSESTARDATSELGGTALQVPLYAAAASRRFGVPATGLYVAGYAHARGREDERQKERAAASVEALVRRDPASPAIGSPIERRALEIVVAARAGELAPLPAAEALCRTCPFSGGCRKPRFAMVPDDEGDP
jgi:hypothetical protein